MWRRCLIIVVLFALGVIPLNAPAWESGWTACEQQNLEGTWSAEVWGGCPDGIQCWDQFTLTIGPNGTIQGGDTYTNCSGASFLVTGGQLTMDSTCSIEGTIVTENGTINVGPGAIINGQLVLGTPEA